MDTPTRILGNIKDPKDRQALSMLSSKIDAQCNARGYAIVKLPSGKLYRIRRFNR